MDPSPPHPALGEHSRKKAVDDVGRPTPHFCGIWDKNTNGSPHTICLNIKSYQSDEQTVRLNMFYLSALTNKSLSCPRRPGLNLEFDFGAWWCQESRPPPSLPTPCTISHWKGPLLGGSRFPAQGSNTAHTPLKISALLSPLG